VSLDGVTIDIKAPLKIEDAAGVVKKVFLIDKLDYAGSDTITFHVKLPFAGVEPLINDSEFTMNLTMSRASLVTPFPYDVSYFKIRVYATGNMIYVDFDNTLNHAKILFKNTAVVKYTDADTGEEFFYLKLFYANTLSSYHTVSLEDISTTNAFPTGFKFENMLVKDLTADVYDNAVFKIVNAYQDAIRKNGTVCLGIIGDGEDAPNLTHAHLYEGLTSWTKTTLATGIYAWKCTVE
jgi:hypothetical protein